MRYYTGAKTNAEFEKKQAEKRAKEKARLLAWFRADNRRAKLNNLLSENKQLINELKGVISNESNQNSGATSGVPFVNP